MSESEKFNASHREAAGLLKKGDYGNALDMLVQMEPSVHVLNDRAVALHQLGRTEEALEALEEALRLDGENVPAMLNRRYMGFAVDAVKPPPEKKALHDSEPMGGTAPAVSVVIPTYDRPEYLEETIKSVLDQTFTDFELIVVNDGGPDDAPEILKRMDSDKIRYLKIEHGGISAALNAGVALARGKYIAYLDDDDIYLPDHLETLKGYFNENPHAMFAYTLSYRCIQHRIEGEWKTAKKKPPNAYPYDREKLVSSNLIQTTGSIMHRRELVEEIGGFNENIIGSQDWEWYLRVSERHPLHYIDKPTVEHMIRRDPGEQLSGDPAIMRRNNITVRYMHKLLVLTSDVSVSSGKRRALKKVGELFNKWPEIIDMFDVNELANRKPYACLYRLGRDLSGMGEKEKARAAFIGAFTVAPWEIKIYLKMFFP